ncbi:MAG: TRAP transporter small permease [Rhodobacter sp.]|nr:TRAP transporter small permease [Rhodobacter sp.]
MYLFFLKLSRLMAYLGGAMLTALILLTCLSVIGRSLNGMLHSDLIQGLVPGFASWALGLGIGPINGDFELIEAGVAFSIFAFLPLCQMTGGHASVDVFTNMMSARANRLLRVLTDLVFAAVLVLIAVQHSSGMFSKVRSGQTTFLIEFPVWWAYALSLTGAVVAAVVAVYLALVRVREILGGRDILPADLGAGH